MKFLSLAALALTFAACSSNDDDILPAEQPAEQPGEVTITATISPSEGARTRALSLNGENIKSTWTTTDEFAILFNVGSTPTKRIASVTDVTSDGIATISFTIPASGVTDGAAASIVYPASAVTGTSFDPSTDVAPVLAKQDGTIANCPEVRSGTGTISTSTNTLTIDGTGLAAQNAIFKFTVRDAASSNLLSVMFLIATIGSQHFTITPASSMSEFYVALPAVSGQTVGFVAPGCKFSKDGVNITAGKYYQSTLKMTDVSSINLASQTTDYVAQYGDKLIGTLGANVKISIADGATVTLHGVTINGENDDSYQWAGITCEGDAIIILRGTNTVKGFHKYYPGIYVPENKTLTILSAETSASLTATTFSNGTTSSQGAGIGGGWTKHCGNIVIEGGNITAKGGDCAAGIGGGDGNRCGNITISGGTVWTSTAGYAAGIGSGRNGSCGDIMITTGVTSVRAGGNFAPNSIGAGAGGTCGTVTIGGVVTGNITTNPYAYEP